MLTTIRKAVTTTIATAVVALPAYAGSGEEPLVLNEVDSCVAEVMKRIDTSDVTRVRHLVTDFAHTSRGVKLRIQTSTFTPTDQSVYSAYCVAKGDNAPTTFRLKELSS